MAEAKVMVQDATPKKVMALASRKYSRDDKVAIESVEKQDFIETPDLPDLDDLF